MVEVQIHSYKGLINEIMQSVFDFHHALKSFPLFHYRDIDGRMLLDIFDEKLHPLSVRPQPKINFPYAQTRAVRIHQED